MKRSQVAAQLYTIRDHLKTPQDTAKSMRKIRSIGYEAVQVSGMGPIGESELVKILDGEGLKCCATHEPTAAIFNETQKVIDRLHQLGCAYTAIPHYGQFLGETAESMRAFAAMCDKAGMAMKNAGIVLTYHNHNDEFRKIGGELILERIYALTDPANLQGEIDTYWVQAGGGNPVEWCARLKNRLPLLHMKDFGVNRESRGVFAEIGNGNLDWKAIIAAAEGSGAKWFIVEQDGDWLGGDPFASLKVSFEYIAGNLAKQ